MLLTSRANGPTRYASRCLPVGRPAPSTTTRVRNVASAVSRSRASPQQIEMGRVWQSSRALASVPARTTNAQSATQALVAKISRHHACQRKRHAKHQAQKYATEQTQLVRSVQVPLQQTRKALRTAPVELVATTKSIVSDQRQVNRQGAAACWLLKWCAAAGWARRVLRTRRVATAQPTTTNARAVNSARAQSRVSCRASRPPPQRRQTAKRRKPRAHARIRSSLVRDAWRRAVLARGRSCVCPRPRHRRQGRTRLQISSSPVQAQVRKTVSRGRKEVSAKDPTMTVAVNQAVKSATVVQGTHATKTSLRCHRHPQCSVSKVR